MKMAVRGFFKGAFFNLPCHSLDSAMFDAGGLSRAEHGEISNRVALRGG